MEFNYRNWFEIRVILFISVYSILTCSGLAQSKFDNEIKIAFLADVHFHDVYGQLQDSDYKGVLNPETGLYAIPRTMQSQLSSTRLFNENYFAFIAALDDVVHKGAKYIVLPGDFSDDGQPLNVRRIKQILNEYSSKYAIRFFVTTGNHDPVKPYKSEGGKLDFLGYDGHRQAIVSHKNYYKNHKGELPQVISEDLSQMGYREITSELSEFGLMPQKNDIYWESPFSTYGIDDYSFRKAKQQANVDSRRYQANESDLYILDVSYLVEPEEGLWFLAIDASVYLPKDESGRSVEEGEAYTDALGGYTHILQHKPYLLDWVKKVCAEAQKRGKKLITYSHYPILDFNDEASSLMGQLMGAGKLQLHRVPVDSVSMAFAEAGVKVHFGGHMHINDTGFKLYDDNSGLVNIQVPSLAAYIPGYKMASLKEGHLLEVKTIMLDSIPRFKELFPLYRMEHEQLTKSNNPEIWNADILESKSYRDFTSWHLKELVRLRFIDKDWPAELKEFLLQSTGNEICQFVNVNQEYDKNWNKQLNETWTGYDLILDFYRLRSADRLALADIGEEKINQYLLLFDCINENVSDNQKGLKKDLKTFVTIMNKLMTNKPVDTFIMDLNTGLLIK